MFRFRFHGRLPPAFTASPRHLHLGLVTCPRKRQRPLTVAFLFQESLADRLRDVRFSFWGTVELERKVLSDEDYEESTKKN